MSLWDVLPDGERQRWFLEPFVSVGPLRFDTGPDEVSAVLGRDPAWTERRDPSGGVSHRRYSEPALTLYFTDERLSAVSIDARRGPQVMADGVATVGRVPSVLERWLIERAETREPFTELFYMPSAEAGSLTLGVVLCVQRAGDSLITRPVFLAADTVDDAYHRLPSDAWAV